MKVEYYLWISQRFHCALVGRTQRCEIDEHVGVRVFLHGVRHVLVDGNQDLGVTPVKLLFMITT